MELKRGIDAAVTRVVAEVKKLATPTKEKATIAQVGTISANGDQTIGDDARRRDGEGRQGRRHHRRGGEGDRVAARGRRGHAVRPRLPLAVLRDQPREDARRARRRVHPHQREEGLEPARHPAAARAGRQGRAPAPHHRRGRRRARRWPRWWSTSCAGLLKVVRRQGARLRRPPKGDAQGHRDPHGRSGRHRGSRHQARELHSSRISGEPSASRSTRTTRRSSTAPGTRSRSRVASRASARRSRRRPATTTRRSSRSGWRSSPAASRS